MVRLMLGACWMSVGTIGVPQALFGVWRRSGQATSNWSEPGPVPCAALHPSSEVTAIAAPCSPKPPPKKELGGGSGI